MSKPRNSQERPQPLTPTMQGYVMRIVLQIFRDADRPLSNNQIEALAAQYRVPMQTAKGIVMAGGHTITDSRTTIRALRGMGYDIRSEWRKNQYGNRYKVYWLVEHTDNFPPNQLSLFE